MKLTKGVALVLTGKEGCGKTSVARRIAAENGLFIEVGSVNDLGILGWKCKVFNRKPKTIIVEEFMPPTKKELNIIKAWLVNDEIEINLRGELPKKVPLPNFIFCSNYSAGLNLLNGDRRFQIYHLDDDNNEVIHEKSPSEFQEWVDKKIAAIG